MRYLSEVRLKTVQWSAALLCGAGDNFSSGVDLSGFSEEGADPQALFNAAALAIAEFDKPLVAAVQGASVGWREPRFYFMPILFTRPILFACDCHLPVLV